MSDQPPTLYPGDLVGPLIYSPRKCCDCSERNVAWTMDGLRCSTCARQHMDREQGKHWADHVLRRVETDPEFRERLRAALGVTQ